MMLLYIQVKYILDHFNSLGIIHSIVVTQTPRNPFTSMVWQVTTYISGQRTRNPNLSSAKKCSHIVFMPLDVCFIPHRHCHPPLQ